MAVEHQATVVETVKAAVDGSSVPENLELLRGL